VIGMRQLTTPNMYRRKEFKIDMLDNMELRYDIERVKSAISRNLEEVNSALLKLTAYIKLCEIDISCVGMSFFCNCWQAMYNDMLVNVFRALDLHPDADSFWYIERIIPVRFEAPLRVAMQISSR